MIKNIKKIIDIKNKKLKITVGVGFVVTESNYTEILDFAKIFKDIDVDYCYIPEIIQIERQQDKNNLGKVQISQIFGLKVINLLDEAKIY